MKEPILGQASDLPRTADTRHSIPSAQSLSTTGPETLYQTHHILWYFCLRAFRRAAFCFIRSSKINRSRKTVGVGAGAYEAEGAAGEYVAPAEALAILLLLALDALREHARPVPRLGTESRPQRARRPCAALTQQKLPRPPANCRLAWTAGPRWRLRGCLRLEEKV